MTLAVLIGDLDTPHGRVRLSLHIAALEGSLPAASLVLETPDGNGSGGSHASLFDPPSVEISLDRSGALWLFGVAATGTRSVTCDGEVGTIIRPQGFSLAFYVLRAGQLRVGDVTFMAPDGEPVVRSFTAE